MNTIELETRIAERRAFIESCELGDCQPVNVAKHVAMDFKADIDEQSPEAFVANDTVVSIVAGMSKKNRVKVKDCMLFASLAASTKFPEGGVAWYNYYRFVLAYCGWTPSLLGLSKYNASKSTFTMEQVGLEIIASAVTAAALPGPASLLLQVAKDAIATLQKSEKPLRIFESSSKKHSGAKFAIGSVVESKDKQLVMALGAIDFTTSLNVTNVLFWEWSSSSVSINGAGDHLVFVSRQFDDVADVIRGRLTEVARRKLAEIEF